MVCKFFSMDIVLTRRTEHIMSYIKAVAFFTPGEKVVRGLFGFI